MKRIMIAAVFLLPGCDYYDFESACNKHMSSFYAPSSAKCLILQGEKNCLALFSRRETFMVTPNPRCIGIVDEVQGNQEKSAVRE